MRISSQAHANAKEKGLSLIGKWCAQHFQTFIPYRGTKKLQLRLICIRIKCIVALILIGSNKKIYISKGASTSNMEFHNY